MAEDSGIITGSWEPRVRVDEELEFFTELALHETERWVEAVTRNKFKYPDDPRKSLETGVLLCELLNCLKPGSIKKVNRLPTPIAFLDNLHVFLEACAVHFDLKDSQLFDYCDLEDLSTRAISDFEDQLKYETDRRLRNVAITIFWLGRAARQYFDGPHLDLTAFSDLVNHQVAPHETSPPVTSHFRDESSDSATESQASEGAPPVPSIHLTVSQHERQVSSDSVDHSSAYGSYRSDPKSSQSSVHLEGEEGGQHLRDDSYDSVISEDPIAGDPCGQEPSAAATLESTVDNPHTMPVRYDDLGRQHSSYNKPSEIRYSATFESVYDGSDSDSMNRDGEQYQSTPSLNSDIDSRAHFNRFRFGSQEGINSRSDSVDSLDYNRRAGSDHSRQSSGSGDYLLPRPSYRRTSTTSPKPAANPLQFVKQEKENPLAEHAKEVVDVMEKQKKDKAILQSGEDDWQSKPQPSTMPMDEAGDWVSNLSAWKSKMRRKSAATYTRAIEADEVMKQEEVDTQGAGGGGGRRNKTFKEMMQERERRKSGNFNIYPFGEDGDDTVAVKTKEPEPPKPQLSSQTEDMDEYGFVRRKKKIDTKDDKLSKLRGVSLDEKPKSDDKFSKWRTLEKESMDAKDESNNKAKKWRTQPSKSVDSSDKFTKWKSLETKDDDKFSRWRQREKEGESDFKKEKSPPFQSEIPKQDRFARWRNDENDNDDVFKPQPHSASRDSSRDQVAPWACSPELERKEIKRVSDINKENNNDKYTSHRWNQPDSWTGERTFQPETHRTPRSNNFSTLLGSSQPQTGYDEQVPSNTAKYSMESSGQTPPSNRRLGAINRPPVGLIENYIKEHSHHETSSTPQYDKREVRDLPKPNESYSESGEWSRMSKQEDSNSGLPTRQEDSNSGPPTRQDDHKKTSVEKTIKINQKPGNPRGFGFVLKGGKEDGTQLSISKVSIGSAADVCELLAGDEVVAVNGADVGQYFRETVMHVVNQAVQTGQLELRIRRLVTTGWDDEDSFDIPDEPPTNNRRLWPSDDSQGKDGTTNLGSPQEGRNSPDSIESLNSEDEAYEQQIMEQLEKEAEDEREAERLHEQTLHEDDLARQESLEQEEEKDREEDEEEEDEEEEDGDVPPPIPSEPPPAPNWDTFPSGGMPDEDLKDVLPDASRLSLDNPDTSAMRETPDKKTPAVEALDAMMRIRTDALRRRSEYLGIDVEDMEEYQKLHAERDREAQRIAEREREEESKRAEKELEAKRNAIKERLKAMKREEIMRESLENATPPPAQKPTDLLWQQIETPTRDTDNTTNFGTGTYGFKSQYDLEEAEREIIENLEREERSLVVPPWKHHENKEARSKLKPWQSHDTGLEEGERYSTRMEARVLKDMESTLESAPPHNEKPFRSSMRFFDFDADRKRMEEWDRTHERERQQDDMGTFKVETQINLKEQFARDQEEMRKRYEEEQRISELKMEEKRQQEAAMLEKELAHQRELEIMRQRQEEERERRRAEEEKLRRQQEQEERRRKIQEEQRRKREEEEERRRKLEQEEEQRKKEKERRRKKEEEEARHRQEEAEHARNRQREWEMEEVRRKKEEAELQKKLQRQKMQIEQASPSKPHSEYSFRFSVNNPNQKAPWQHDDRDRMEKEEAALVAEERAALRVEELRLRQLEEERRQREEREASQLKEREDQLRSMEERIKREAEALKAERDRLIQEKHQRHQAWNLDTDKPYPPPEDTNSAGYPYTPTEAPVSQLSDYTSPLQVDVGKQPSYTTGEVHVELSGDKKGTEYSKPQMEPGYGYQELNYALKGTRDHSPPEKDERSRPQFKVEIQTDPDRRVIVNRGSSSSPQRETSYYQSNMSRSTSETSLRPPLTQSRPPSVARKEPLRVSTSPSATPDLVTRREILDLNKPRVSPRIGMPQTTQSMDEITVRRPTLDWNKRPVHKEEPTHQYSQSMDGSDMVRDTAIRLNQRPTGPRPDDYWMRPEPSQHSPLGVPRDERVSPRRSWQQQDEPMGSESGYSLQGDQGGSRRGLHSLSATPKQRIISGNDWIVSEEERKRQERLQRQNRHADIMKHHVQNTSDHWLVEEAERRRVADRSGHDRPTNLQSRPTHMGGNNSGYWSGGEPGHYQSHDTDNQSGISQRSHDPVDSPPRVQAVLYRSPTHIMEHTEAPDQDMSRPTRPIPEAIKQTLIQRVTLPKQSSNRSPSSSQGPPSPNFPYSGYGAQPQYQGPVFAKTVQYNPSSQSPFSQPSYPQTYQDDSPPFRYPPTVPYTGQYPAPTSQYLSPDDPRPPVPPTKPPRTHLATPSGGGGGTHAEAVVAVSGRQQCAHCEEELGHGAAMVIESLSLYYHVQCFRCCVCHAPLGTGQKGADVRVRVSKLHCQNCYSNDEVGLKFSRV